LAQTPYGEPAHLELAAHGFAFLRDRLRDPDHAGFFWEVDVTGKTPTRANKHLYGQAFALYALSEYARAASDPQALTLARDLFLTIEQNARDLLNGGYEEFFLRNWGPVPPGEPGYLTPKSGVKQFNTHVHLLEAFTEYFRVSRDPLARERILELILVLSNAVVRKTVGACTDMHRPDWMPIEPAQADVSYGHDLENVWLLWEACYAVDLPNGPLLDLYRTLFLNAWRFGFDRERGGFFQAGRPGMPADHRVKTWWVQAECMVCALLMHGVTGEAPYYGVFSRTLDWIMRHQADWEFGDWHGEVGEDGTSRGDKASAWKTPYHNGRAVLRCLELLEPLIEASSPPVAGTPPS
jgi:mannobiose 2-epimerase